MLQLILTAVYILCEITNTDQLTAFTEIGASNNISDSATLLPPADFFQEVIDDGFIFTKDLPEGDFREGSGDSKETEENINPRVFDTNNCIESGYNTVCSNHGQCIDNKCVCNSYQFEIENTTILYRFSGKYCEECPYCGPQRCHQFLPCIECHSFLGSSECELQCGFRYKIVEVVTRDVQNDEKMCDTENSKGCFFKFKYSYDSENFLEVQYEKQYWCFHGTSIVLYTFLGVIIYIFTLAFLISHTCLLNANEEINRTPSISTRHDVLRTLQVLNNNSHT